MAPTTAPLQKNEDLPPASFTTVFLNWPIQYNKQLITIMSDEEDIAALVIDNGSGMCKGKDNKGSEGSEVKEEQS